MRPLIVFPRSQVEVADEIKAQLREGARARNIKMRIPNIEHDAESAIDAFKRERFTHLVVDQSIPPTRKASPRADCSLSLASMLKELNKDLSIVMMASRPKPVTPTSNGRSGFGIPTVKRGIDGIPELISVVLDDHCPTPVVNIVIDLSQGDRTGEFIVTRNDNLMRPRNGFLDLRPHDLDNLRELSRALNKSDDWSQQLVKLRGQLYDSLLHSSLSKVLNDYVKDDDQEYEVRVCFNLDEANSDVAFEAIRHPRTEDYWMLHAPIVRSFRVTGGGMDPVSSRFNGRINHLERCLVILSDAHGVCRFRDQNRNFLGEADYEPLSQAKAEYEAVIEMLDQQCKRTQGRNTVRSLGHGEKLTPELLGKTLDEEWDLIHYIGHSDFQFNEGYFILPGDALGEAKPVSIATLAPRLRKTPFVYLSSCFSSHTPFVRRLAEQRVPCALGFRNRVPDEFAVEHAKCFYQRLFKLTSIEQAFLQTRQQFKEKPVRWWACPSLVVQMH